VAHVCALPPAIDGLKTGTDLFFGTDFPKSIRKIDLSRFFEVYVGVLLVSKKHPLPLFTA
jgi:hypothetical protein